jgi:hypothetical protein
MMKTSYYVACHTKCKCTPEEYETESEKLKELFTLILTDPDKIHAMTHTEDLTSVHSELQVSHDSAGLVGKCVVDIEAPVRVSLDKGRLSVFLKANSNWPAMRVEKKGVFSD